MRSARRGAGPPARNGPQRWALGIYTGPSPLSLAPAPRVNPALTRWEVTDVPAGFVADPFLLHRDGTWYLFFEVWNEASGKGEIGLAVSAGGRRFRYQGIVLAEPFHLSYPQVFVWRRAVFLLPETLGAGAVRLYRATAFPGGFAPVADLVPGELADATLFRHAGRWWMLACSDPHTHGTLELFGADRLTGSWQRHPESPLVAGDPRTARPAGRVVRWKGRPWRFAQDCGPVYGWRVRAFEVLELTRERYREREHAASPVLVPTGKGWNGARMHHLDVHRLADGTWLACVDGYGVD